MQRSKLSDLSFARGYDPPTCKVVCVRTCHILCESDGETERVDEEDGEW